MLAAHGDLRCDVLKAGHHGSKNATGDDWLSRLQPRHAVISCGRHNHFGHPAPSTLARLNAHGVEVFRTDRQGAITFVSDGKTVTARPFLRISALSDRCRNPRHLSDGAAAEAGRTAGLSPGRKVRWLPRVPGARKWLRCVMLINVCAGIKTGRNGAE